MTPNQRSKPLLERESFAESVIPPHLIIVIKNTNLGQFQCCACKATENIPLPMTIAGLAFKTGHFVRKHQHCAPRPSLPPDPIENRQSHPPHQTP